MSFAAVIEDLAATAHAQANFLTDGRIICRYQELPPLLQRINHYLLSQKIDKADCLALECTNSIPGALVLLCLLQEGYRFMLLPPVDAATKALDLKPLPGMCRYRLSLEAVPAELAGDWRIENVLKIEKNAHYQPAQNAIENSREKLYLRTSGSMGASKIVVHSHTGLLENARNCVERFQLVVTDRVAIAVPIFHMYGLGAGFLPAVMAGASIDLQEKTNLLKYLERERQFDPQVAFLTPALSAMLLQRPAGTRRYRAAVSAGARLKEEIIRAFDDRFGPLLNLYGSSELGAISAPAPTDPLELRATTIGRPMAGVTLEVRGKQFDEGAETRTGELYCRHSCGFEAYIEESSGAVKPAETWFKTGDLAHIAANGAIQILGRADNSINRDGYLVLFADIEKALETIEAIAQVVVVASRAEHKRGQHLAAFCILNEGVDLDSTRLRARCFEVLPRYAVPDEVILCETFPTLPGGKVDRQALIVMLGGAHE